MPIHLHTYTTLNCNRINYLHTYIHTLCIEEMKESTATNFKRELHAVSPFADLSPNSYSNDSSIHIFINGFLKREEAVKKKTYMQIK